jgi:hypothetical protein
MPQMDKQNAVKRLNSLGLSYENGQLVSRLVSIGTSKNGTYADAAGAIGLDRNHVSVEADGDDYRVKIARGEQSAITLLDNGVTVSNLPASIVNLEHTPVAMRTIALTHHG